jgi:ATP-dependent exoDNAse (exonuclease V) alpha subunit
MSFVSNPQFDLAFEYVRNTGKNIFLTGKAGTGKTTFLHQVKEGSSKRTVITAPTGVAAINAGGMTLHSFFQLPMGLYLPNTSREANNQRRFSRDKIQLLRTLDLLVIDEISMVRADLLDAVDDVLRRYRDDARAFGGVQLLMIGDLHQLPPVVKQEDWELLRPHYVTPYFFGSLALQRTDMVAIELKHIFRQSDRRFIDLLDKVRNNQIDAPVLETLNSRYIPGFKPGVKEPYITLTSHNASSYDLNAQRLEALPERSRTFKAKIVGDFPETSYPTEETLEFKKGAQVMFVRNDLSPEKRYFNGKIGKIIRLAGDEIFVRCKDERDDIAVTPIEWQNIKYSIDEETKEIKENVLGTFTQYPLKLAWSITIHKSQGLTFDRVIIDARSAFAHGQVYVALSRCRSSKE